MYYINNKTNLYSIN